jgi:hypothetical protein
MPTAQPKIKNEADAKNGHCRKNAEQPSAEAFHSRELYRRTVGQSESFTRTCRRHNIDPQLYLTQLLMNLPAIPISRLSDWLPDRWKQRNPQPMG